MFRFIQSCTELVYSREISRPVTLDLPQGFEWMPLDEDSVRRFFEPSDDWRCKAYLRLLKAGCVGQVIYKGDTWASVGWVSTPTSAPPPHLSRRLIGPNYWTFYVHTAQEFRGRGLQKEGLKLRINAALEHGVSRRVMVYTDTGATNVYSRRAKISMGFVPHGVIYRKQFRLPKTRGLNTGHWDKYEDHPPLEGVRAL